MSNQKRRNSGVDLGSLVEDFTKRPVQVALSGIASLLKITDDANKVGDLLKAANSIVEHLKSTD